MIWKSYFTIALLALISTSYGQTAEIGIYDTEVLEAGPGPEDMVLDTLDGRERLLISCTGRRDEYKPYGEIEAIDLASGERRVLGRKGEPDDLHFRPHGIFQDDSLLYVISHENEPDYHPILVYRITQQELLFRELIHTPYMHSPNALCVVRGDIYLVNDSGKRGSLMEKALKRKKASVVRLRLNPEGIWTPKLVAERLGYPAGINFLGDTLFAGDAILHRIHMFRISVDGLDPLGTIEKLKGNDNIRMHHGRLVVPGHVKPLKFVRHAKNKKHRSPVEVFYADPATGKTKVLFENDGSLISGASTAIIYKNRLYLCQVFEPAVLRVTLDPD